MPENLICKLPSVPSKKPNRNTGNLSHTLEPILDTPRAHKTQIRIRLLFIPNGHYVYTVCMCMYMYIQSMLARLRVLCNSYYSFHKKIMKPLMYGTGF